MPAGGTENTAQRTVLAFVAEIVGDFCKKNFDTLFEQIDYILSICILLSLSFIPTWSSNKKQFNSKKMLLHFCTIRAADKSQKAFFFICNWGG
jgi:hypothetical protein